MKNKNCKFCGGKGYTYKSNFVVEPCSICASANKSDHEKKVDDLVNKIDLKDCTTQEQIMKKVDDALASDDHKIVEVNLEKKKEIFDVVTFGFISVDEIQLCRKYRDEGYRSAVQVDSMRWIFYKSESESKTVTLDGLDNERVKIEKSGWDKDENFNYVIVENIVETSEKPKEEKKETKKRRGRPKKIKK